MKERPILFSGEMVQAILEGRKTQTRRVIKPQPPTFPNMHPAGMGEIIRDFERKHPCPYGQPGDRLWVRETWRPCECQRCNAQFSHGLPPIHEAEYRADGNDPHGWKPSIYMPRWASRILLEVVNVRVEKVQDMSRNDAIAEGIHVLPLQDANDPSAWWESAPGENQARTPENSFEKLWNSINARRGCSWGNNPWVWVIEFKKVEESICQQ